jgi:hypothetical protein
MCASLAKNPRYYQSPLLIDRFTTAFSSFDLTISPKAPITKVKEMSDLLKSIVEWLGKQRHGMALLLTVALIALSFLGLYKIRTQPVYGEILQSAPFIFISVCLICAFLFACTSREKWGKAPWLRYVVRSLGVIAVVVTGALVGAQYFRAERRFSLDIVLLGPQQIDYQTLDDILRDAPTKRFRLHLVDRTDDPTTVAEVLTNSLPPNTNAPNRGGDAATVFVMGSALPDNSFGIAFPNRHLSVYTTALYTIETNIGPSPYQYAINRAFCGAMICGSRGKTPIPGFHEPKSDYLCLFDHARIAKAMQTQIRNPRLCDVHQAALESAYGKPLVSEYLSILKFDWFTNTLARHASTPSSSPASNLLLANRSSRSSAPEH